MPGPVVSGGRDDGPAVVVEVDVVLDDEPVVVELVDVLVVGVVPVVAGDGHDSEMVATPAGRESDETGAPDGSWKWSVCPSTRVTVTLQSAAEAAGSAAVADTARTAPVVTIATCSFPLLNTLAVLLPPCAIGKSSEPRPRGGISARY